MNTIIRIIRSLPALIMAVMGFALNACNEELLEGPGSSNRISINGDLAMLNHRIRIPQYEEALSVNDVELPSSNARVQNIVTYHETYSLLLRAEVDPPEISGNHLQASHVFIEGDLAFVSYNTKGPEYRGGIEVFNISDIEAPSLIYQMVVEGTDYSSIFYEDGKIYLAGATENVNELDLNSNAILEIMNYPVEPSAASTIVDISSFTATDVKLRNNNIYVSSGSHGGLTILDKSTLEEVTSIGMDDARSIAFNNEFFGVMQGTPARVKIYRIADNSYISSFTVGGAEIPESKSILSMNENSIFVPAGKDGLKVISLSDGTLLEHMELPQIEGVDDAMVVTNGVSINQQKVFCANGAAGMFLSESQPEQTALIGSVNFQSSTNYIETRENVMFVATGLGGLKIIEIVEHTPEKEDYTPIGEWDEDGTPLYLCEKDAPIASELRDKMADILRSRRNLMSLKPEYFAKDVVTDVFLTKDTDLEITFFGETAGYKNVMGYYVYDAGNPPADAEELMEKTIIFPNTSQKGSGGWLRRGNKVCIPGLKAGSVVGFFMIADGWKGEVTEGIRTNYTTKALNTDRPVVYRQTSLLLGIEEKDAMVLSFEDIKLPGGDKDFDDAVFILQTSEPNSVDYSLLTPLE